MFVRITAIRRIFYCICIFIIIFLMLLRGRRYFLEKNEIIYEMASEMEQYIDANGSFIYHTKYKIIQFVEIPLQDRFKEFTDYLDQQSELKEYFAFVPETAYHITLTTLKDETGQKEMYIDQLNKAQELLDKEETFTLCVGKQIFSLDKKEIRLEIVFENTFLQDTITRFQEQWTERFPQLIAEHRKTFYVTLAYQYKAIPNTAMLENLNSFIQNWQDFSFEVYLEPIEICTHTDLLTYKPIVPNEPETIKPNMVDNTNNKNENNANENDQNADA